MPTAARRHAAPPPANAAREAPAAPSVRVLRQFRIVINAVKGHFRAVERQAGVTGAQLWALSVLRARPGIGVSELARALDIHQSTASNLLRALVAAGLVNTQRDPVDRRGVLLQLTPAGTRVLARAPGPFTGVLPDALEKLDHRLLLRLERDLAALIDTLDADTSAASIPLGAGESTARKTPAGKAPR